MQIDFHHGTIYVLARLAGFDKIKAEKLAYASQYVDDAVVGGCIKFNNGAIFKRAFTSHKPLDVRNLDISDNVGIWLPFHFLPGNDGYAKNANPPKDNFIRRMVAKPGSPIAEEMIDHAIAQKNKPYGLHSFGIALHVYADTWSHQGFAGIIHEINDIKNPDTEDDFSNEFLSEFTAAKAPLIGHGQASILPDLPYLQWSYTDGKGVRHERDNMQIFIEAVQHVFTKMQTYLTGSASVRPLDNASLNIIKELFDTRGEAEERHEAWLEAIRNGSFSFGKEDVSYSNDENDASSWKYQALGKPIEQPTTSQWLSNLRAKLTSLISGRIVPNFDYYNYNDNDSFLSSDWKYFHDAAIAHTFYVGHELLPAYGICAA